MREIKFRAWDIEEKIIRPVAGIDLNCGDICETCKDRDRENTYWFAGEFLILMQYTGLKDKNGKEIYEGDAVRFWEGNGFNKYKVGEVWFNSDSLAWEIRYNKDFRNTYMLMDTWHDIEVIGNIHENPELMV